MSHRLPTFLTIIMLSVFISFTGVSARADEVTDLIQQAMDAYNQGDNIASSISLQHAETLIEDKREVILRSYLPDPMAGWREHIDAHNESQVDKIKQRFDDIKRNRKFSVHRHYDNQGREVSVAVEMNVKKNKTAAEEEKMVSIGREKVMIKDYPAFIAFSPESGQGNIKVLLSEKIIVEVQGMHGVTKEELLSYAQNVKYKSFLEYAF
jgi:hypothetical protein